MKRFVKKVFHQPLIEKPLIAILLTSLSFSGASANETLGAWSGTTNFSFIPIHAVNLPDGRILSYGGSTSGGQGGHQVYDIWDPSLGIGPDAHVELPNTTRVDTFCSSMLLMPQSGRVLVMSGDSKGINATVRNKEVITYDWRDNNVTRLDNGVNRQRWYGTPVMNAAGEITIFGGTCWGRSTEACSNNTRHIPEIFRPGQGWSYLSNLDNASATAAYSANNRWWYPRAFLMGSGDIYTLTMGVDQRIVSTEGNGVIRDYPSRGTDHFGSTNSAVMYAPDRVLVTGGGGYDSNGREPDGRAQASIIDLSSGAPVWTAAAPMSRGRQWHNSTVLPDGTVLVTGGSTTNNVLEGVGFEPEIWNPETNRWTTMATGPEARLYHSTAILLQDGRVMTGGGGAPGPLTQRNAALYSPPYLFKAGINNRLKITNGPSTVEWSRNMALTVNDGARVERVTMLAYGAATHSFNFGQRFNELSFSRNGNQINAQVPANPNHAPPGYYMVFALDVNNIPSTAFTIRILADGTVASPDSVELPTPTNSGTSVDRAATSLGYSVSVNGSFEANTIAEGGFSLGSTTGWTGDVEIWRNHRGYEAVQGDSWAEIDGASETVDALSQSFNLTGGSNYVISFSQSPRPGTSAASNEFQVRWNGQVLDTIARAGGGLTALDWKRNSYTVVSQAGTNTLSFTETSTDGLGAMLDDVRVSRVVNQTIISAPTANPDTVNVTSSATVTLSPVTNDRGSGLVLQAPNAWSLKGGRVVLFGNQLRYTPKPGFNGLDKIWYTIKDSQGRTSFSVINLNVSGNTTTSAAAPVANPDTVNVTSSAQVTLSPLANDTGSGLVLQAPNAWSLNGGNVALFGNQLRYTPKAGFNGLDKIWYNVRDSQSRTAFSVININVSGNAASNDVPPSGSIDSVTTTTGATITIDVLANDTGNGLVLTAPNAWSLKGGNVSLVSNKLVYKSKAGFTGNDNIWYVFKDSQGRTSNSRVDITVNASNNSTAPFPIANADNYTVPRNSTRTLGILNNDTPSTGIFIDTLYEYSSKGGKTTKINNREVSYTPKVGFTGVDDFWYVMIDSQGRKNSAKVTINVTP